MIVMQYSFTLPADYDMAIIERRIRDNGARLDDYPGLVFKVYLYARHDDAQQPSHENLYAPLYVWQDADSMRRFFSSAGFAALTQAYGWPTVDTWLLGSTPDAQWVKTCTTAHKRVVPIPAHSSLNTMLPPRCRAPQRTTGMEPNVVATFRGIIRHASSGRTRCRWCCSRSTLSHWLYRTGPQRFHLTLLLFTPCVSLPARWITRSGKPFSTPGHTTDDASHQ